MAHRRAPARRPGPAQPGGRQHRQRARRWVHGRRHERVRAGAHARRHRVVGRTERTARGGEGRATGGRRRALRRCRGGGRRRLQPRGPPARRRAGDRGHSGRGRRRRGRARRGLRRRGRAPLPRRGEGARSGSAGGTRRAALALGPGHWRGQTAWRGCCAGTKPSCGAPCTSAVPPPSTRWTAASCAGHRGGTCRDDRRRPARRPRRRRPHRCHGRRRPLDLARGGARGGDPGRRGQVSLRLGQAAHRRAAPQRRRVPLLVERCCAGWCRHGRDQPDEAGGGARRRRAGHGLLHDRDRR